MTRHIVPNVSPLILANTTLTVPVVILSEAVLAFPRARRPVESLVGEDARRRVRDGRRHGGGLVGVHPARLGILLVALAFTLCGFPRWKRSSTRGWGRGANEPARGQGPARDLQRHRLCADSGGAHGVDLTLDVGETIGLAGESGCGKSSLAGALLRLLPKGTEVTGDACSWTARTCLR